MEAKFDSEKKMSSDMKSKKAGGPRIEVSGNGGGIILIGGALIAAAISAAFMVRRATRNGDAEAKSRNRDEERGLQRLLDDQREGEGFSADGSVETQESSVSEKSESERDEGSEESGADQVWPEEVIDNREKELSFEILVEIQKPSVKDSETKDTSEEILGSIVETKDDQNEASTVEPVDRNAAPREFSFWSVEPSVDEIRTEQNLEEREAALVPEEAELAPEEERDEAKEPVGLRKDAGLNVDEETCIEEPKEQVLVDGLEGNQAAENHEVIAEMRESQLEDNADDFNRPVEKSDTAHVGESEEEEIPLMKSQENMERQVVDVAEESEGSRNSSEGFNDNESNQIMEDSEKWRMSLSPAEAEFDPEEEREKAKRAEMIESNEDTGMNEDEETCMAERKDQVLVDGPEENRAVENYEATVETEESQSEDDANDFNHPVEESDTSQDEESEEEEIASMKSQEEKELQAVDAGEESEGPRNSSDELDMLDDKSDQKMEDFKIGKNGEGEKEEETGVGYGDRSVPVQISFKNSDLVQSGVALDEGEGEKGLQSMENGMKLECETLDKMADVASTEQSEQDDNENIEREIFENKRMDFLLVGSPRAFLLVLALALAVGLLVFAHHGRLHEINLFKESYYNRAIGEQS